MKCLVKENQKRNFLLIGLLVFLSSYTVLPIEKIKEKGIVISNNPGQYKNEIQLSAKHTSDIKLYYTFTGNYPGKRDQEFNEPIRIDTVKTILLALYRNDKATDTFYCGTYIVKFQSVLPIVNITVPPADLFDSSRGIYVGWMNQDMETFGNAWKDIEKAAFFEYFPKESPVLSQQVALKIFGGMTRQNKEKSLRVIAKKKYGKGKFKYKVFPTKNIKSFNSLVLRTSGNDFNGTRFLDVMISSIAKDMQIDYLAYQPSVLFVNGQYWGIHNIREKSGKDYLAENHKADENQIDLLLGEGYAEEGSSKDYKSFLNYLFSTPGTTDGFIDTVSKIIDIDNYINFSILQIHIVNPDSRGNIRYWRAKNLDNKFRWIYYDGDLSFYHYNHNFLKDRLSPTQTDWYNPTWSNIILRRLVENPTIRDRFISNYCYMLSTIFEKDTLQKRINYFKNLIRPEIGRHVKRRGFNYSVGNWESHVNRLLLFAQHRGETAYLDLKSEFNLGGSAIVEINTGAKEANASITFNNNQITSTSTIKIFQGIKFELGIANSNPAFDFQGWSDGNKAKNRDVQINDSVNIKLYPLFKKRSQSNKNALAELIGVGFNKKNEILFLGIEWRNKETDSLRFCNETNTINISINKNNKQKFIFVCADTLKVKKDYPKLKAIFVEIKDLHQLIANNNIYLLDSNGDIFDEVEKNSFLKNSPFSIKVNNSWIGVSEKPEWGNGIMELIKEYKNILLAIGGLIVILMAVFILKKKKNVISMILFFLSCSFSLVAQSNRLNDYAKKNFNIETLKKTGLTSTDLPVIDSQLDFLKSYKPHNKALTWIKPFKETDLAWNSNNSSYQVSFYKESTNTSISHGRLKFANKEVILMISGTNYRSFLIDTSSKEYLIAIEHENGMESWYYPVIPNKTIDVKNPGSVIGKCANGFYWQLRYGTRTLLPTGIINKDGRPDPKGVFLENQITPFISLKNRYDAFRKNYKNDIKSIQPMDYNEALKKELEGKNN